MTKKDVLGEFHLSMLAGDLILINPNIPCLTIITIASRYLHDGDIYGNSTGSTSLGAGWDRDTIVAGTKIGMLLEFDPDGTATVTAYKDGVKAGVLSTGSLRGPLCPSVWFGKTDQSVEFVPSNPPHS